jgi:hypothetical protein
VAAGQVSIALSEDATAWYSGLSPARRELVVIDDGAVWAGCPSF